MALGLCEALWLKLILLDLGFSSWQPIQQYYDNKIACNISYNSSVHGRSKHVEINRFFIKEKLKKKIMEFLKLNLKINWLIFSQKQF
jgi:hypothetical protein